MMQAKVAGLYLLSLIALAQAVVIMPALPNEAQDTLPTDASGYPPLLKVFAQRAAAPAGEIGFPPTPVRRDTSTAEKTKYPPHASTPEQRDAASATKTKYPPFPVTFDSPAEPTGHPPTRRNAPAEETKYPPHEP